MQSLADYPTSPLFSPAEKLALALADAATELPAVVSDDLFARLQEHYSEAEIVELAAIVALENFRSRFNRVFQFEAVGLYCPLPPTAQRTTGETG